MAREKKTVHKVQMTDGKRQIIQQLLQEYDIETAEDIQDALKENHLNNSSPVIIDCNSPVYSFSTTP